MFSTGFKGVGLHYTAFANAIREDSRRNTPSRGVSPRKKFADKANVESRVSLRTPCILSLRVSPWRSQPPFLHDRYILSLFLVPLPAADPFRGYNTPRISTVLYHFRRRIHSINFATALRSKDCKCPCPKLMSLPSLPNRIWFPAAGSRRVLCGRRRAGLLRCWPLS